MIDNRPLFRYTTRTISRRWGERLAQGVDVARRCADLLAALARTGNVSEACRASGISIYWAYRRRRADADFARRWVTAVRAGERRAARLAPDQVRGDGAPRIKSGVTIGDPHDSAAGLIVQGRAGTGTRRLQRPPRDSFSAGRRAAFLDALRVTCNVKAARIAAGVGSTTVYRHYHEDAGFRAEWDAALAEGRAHLEMALIAAGRALFEGPEGEAVGKACPADEAGAITGMDAKVALQLLRLHAPRDAAGRKSGRQVKAADAEATRREILAKVAAVRRARPRLGGRGDPGSSPG